MTPKRDHDTGCFRQPLDYPADVATLFMAIRDLPMPVLLSSGDNAGAVGRYDILSAAPWRRLRSDAGRTWVSDADDQLISESSENPFDVLRREYEAVMPAVDPQRLPSPFPGGVLGYFGYELLHPWQGIEQTKQRDIALPDMLAGLYRWGIVVDHHLQRCEFIGLPDLPESQAEALLERLVAAPTSLPAIDSFSLTAPFNASFTEQAYAAAFRRVIDYIHAGDCYQVNLAQHFSTQYRGDPFAAFRHLHKLANAPFSAYIEDGEDAVLSFSPERFIQVSDLSVKTQPIKGTRPRHSDPEQDRALLAELVNSPKDQAENLMIVDLLRNDLGRVCQTGSVQVPSLFETQSFNNVHHLVSTVTGRLEQASDRFALFSASFPGGSITGAPKIRAMEIINELESRPRSVYCGVIGWMGFNGDMDSNISIRTLVASGGNIHCWGGGGVVADSICEREYQETFDKISLFMNNLPVADHGSQS